MPDDDIHLGRILLGRYRALRLLGRGAHGRVYVAEDLMRGGERVALKLIEGLVGAGHDEPGQETLRTLRHPSWAEVLDAGRFAEYDWFQVTRYVDGPSLDRLDGPQPAAWVARFLEDGARVLRALHLHGLIHYDVTPGNWLVEGQPDAPRFVLTDGGLAHAGPVQGFARGTPLYMAPEVTEDRGHDHRVDLYSLGLVAYRLATGSEPLAGKAGDVLGRRRREPAPHPRDRRPDLPAELDAIIADLLAPDPGARIKDAGTLLERLERLAPGLPTVRPEEALAVATGGSLVGRQAEQQRFALGLQALSQHLPPGSSSRPGAMSTRDPVLLVTGPAGSGGTRLVREFASMARAEEIPVLLLAGRDGTPDRRRPLRRLVDGLATLGRQRGQPVPDVPLADRAEDGDETTHSAHGDGRAIERFLTLVDEAASRTPLLLIVEDFGDLPPLAQEAISVLARHHLGRSERSAGAVVPPVMLVVDVGSADANRLVSPDAADPERPLLRLAPLPPPDLEALAQDRFPGLTLAPEDLIELACASDGLPAKAADLLAEAYRRGDLRRDGGAWSWDVAALRGYATASRLAPAIAEALRALPPTQRGLLDHLALLEGDLTKSAAASLWAAIDPAAPGLPSTPLLTVRHQGDTEVVVLASQALRRVLLEALPPSARATLGATLLSVLSAHPDGRTAIDRVALMLDAAQGRAALDWIHGQRAALSHEQRFAVQSLLTRLVTADPALLEDAAARRKLAELLERGPEALTLALALGRALPADGHDLDVVRHIVRVLEEGQDFPAARALLSRHVAVPSDDIPTRAELCVLLARISFSLRQSTNARASLHQAKRLIKSLGRGKRSHPRLLVQYLKTEAQARAALGRLDLAAAQLRLARRLAHSIRSAHLVAETLNNLGIVESERGRPRLAARAWERAIRIKRIIGDVHGLARSLNNLAWVCRRLGDHARALRTLYESSSVARRHGAAATLLIAQRDLGALLDRLHSGSSALEQYKSALTLATRCDMRMAALPIAADMAPLAAAAGRAVEYAQAMHCLAAMVRTPAREDGEREAHAAGALAAAHLGDPARRDRHAKRLTEGHQGHTTPPLSLLLAGLRGLSPTHAGHYPELADVRPWRTSEWRSAIRTGLTLVRCTRKPLRAYGPTVAYARSVLARSALADGPVRRSSLELVLAALPRLPEDMSAHLVSAALDLTTEGSEAVIHARLLAARSMHVSDTGAWRSGRDISAAVQLLDPTWASVSWPLPQEVAEALAHHAAPTGTTGQLPAPRSLTDAHALAHRVLARAGAAQPADQRLSTALRNVLEATARMPAGSSLTDLLHAMTRHATEITGAQRACVVLVDSETSGGIRIATSTASSGRQLRDREVSQTVLQRVLSSGTPLLLHDVFSDEDLMGRPSVTSMALRSILCVPLKKGERTYGVMYADHADAAGSFDAVDLEVLTLFAQQAAAAIELNRLVSSLQGAYADLKSMQDRLVRGERLRVIGELSSGVAHEFNNLLTAILARVQLMGLSVHDQETQRSLRLVEQATLDAAGVVRRLQSFSREQRTADQIAVVLAEACADAVEFLRPLWSARRRHGRPQIIVRTHFTPELFVRGNPTELREIVTNLLKNALDAVGERGGTVSISTQVSNGRVQLRVKDSGPGIPPENLPKIFDPFFTTKGESGTGLGLCLTQQMAERHGGEVAIESRVGEGTTAVVSLPLLDRPPTVQVAGIGAPSAVRPRGRKVLIVDDDLEVLRPLCAYLERSGYVVSSAQDGEQALRSATTDHPDVVLSDIVMPKMDGIELCQQIAAQWPSLPVVLMSGWASDVDTARAKALGARAVLSKPFAMQQVADLLASISVN